MEVLDLKRVDSLPALPLAGAAHAKYEKCFVRDRWPDHHSPILDGSAATGVAAAVCVATTVGGAVVARGSATMVRERASPFYSR